MSTQDDLNQQLYELIYGLLPDDEAARLNDRITSEPDVARAYATVKQQTDVLAKAARLHGPMVKLERPTAEEQKVEAKRGVAGDAVEIQRDVAAPWALKWIVGLAAAALLCITGYYAYGPSSPVRDSQTADVRQTVANEHLRMVVTAPAQFTAGAPGSFSVATSSVDRRPLPAQVQYALYSPDTGEKLIAAQADTGKDGRALISLPPDKLIAGARLEIEARRTDGQQQDKGADSAVRMTTRVEVEKIRYATQLTTDKPLYRPGEAIRFRSLTLTRFGLESDRELPVAFQLLDPAGGIVPGSEQSGYTRRGVAGGEFAIPPHFSGGTYTLVVRSTEEEAAFPEERRDLFVRKYRLPRLKKELEFTRDSYAPGDTVIADFQAERAEGGVAAEAQLLITATVDGANVFSGSPEANPDGTYRVEFNLPQEIETGDGTLSVVVDDGGNRETIAKTIPINLGKIEVQFYPEGGELVAGLENRVYFYGHDPLGEPIDIKLGRIVDGDGQQVAKLGTYHEGRGVFRFTPAAGETYRLEIVDPVDMTLKGELPKATRKSRVVINTGAGVFAGGQPIELNVLATQAHVPLVITAVCRGTQVAQQEFQTALVSSVNDEDAARSLVKFDLPAEVSGVVRITAYDYSTSPPKPLAERLVYRRPLQKLNVTIGNDGTEYSPGEHVAMALRVTDESGRPRAAALGLSVVDDALLNLADVKTPALPTYFYLASEIEKPEDLEDANFYLLSEKQKDKSPAKALDLLLGTQGWRRFVQIEDLTDGAIDEQVADATANDESKDDAVEDEARTKAIEHLVAMEGTHEYPTLYDNLPEIEPQYESDVSLVYREREAAITNAGYISFLGGAALLCVVVILAILQLAKEYRFWVPVSAVAVVCLIAGGIWMSMKIDAQGKTQLVGFAGFDATAVVAKTEEATGEFVTLDTEGEDATEIFDLAEPADPFDAPDDAPMEAEELAEAAPGADDDADGVVADLPPAADPAPEPAAPPAILEPNQPFPADEADFDDAFFADEEREMSRFDELGPLADDLKDLDVGFLREGWMKPGEGDYIADREKQIWFDGSHHDVARMRTLLQRAMKAGDEKATMKIGKAYEKLLAQYQMPVRQYAHQHIAGEPGVRSDFTEVLYWNPLVIADENGRAAIEFDLSDSVTTFIVKADAHGGRRIGTGGGKIVSRIPFSLEPKLPLEVNAGDRIELPLAVNNDTKSDLPVGITFSQMGELLKLNGEVQRKLQLTAGQRYRETFTLDVVGQTGVADLKFAGSAGPLTDAIAKRLTVVPPGFPVAQSYSGQIDGETEVKVELPEDWVEGSLEVTLSAFPSSLADLQKGMAGMLRDPNGCFEQTSSSNYPNVLALTYMQEHDVADPAFTKKAKDLLQRGYDKLVSFECAEAPSDKKAFEWFGGWPAHEALTAYGILEFEDMAQVHDVDPKLIERATNWLLDRRDGEGGFKRNPRALDSFGGAPQDITNAYIVWALTEAKQEGLTEKISQEIDHVVAKAGETEDPYIIALAAARAYNAGREGDAKKLMELLATHQQEDGRLDAKETSITRSGGISLQVETTALAALAWLKDPAMTAHANKAVQWITDNRQGSGGFGATQSTIMALKALIEHSKANKKTVTEGELIVRRDGEEVAKQAFGAGENGAIEIEGLAAQLNPGENELTIVLTGENQMPYALDVRYRAATPVSDDACPVRLATDLSAESMSAGDTAQVNVRLDNTSGQGQPMTVAIVGLPAGLEPRVEHLEELKEAGQFDYYELNAREIVFYWRDLSPETTGDEAIDFDVDVIAEIPGRYTAPASRAYLYYTAEQKHWVTPLAVEIAAE